MESYLVEEMEKAKFIIARNSFIFIWQGGHTVNIYGAYSEEEMDVISIGNFATDKTTTRDFINGVKRYIKNMEWWKNGNRNKLYRT